MRFYVIPLTIAPFGLIKQINSMPKLGQSVCPFKDDTYAPMLAINIWTRD